MRNYLIPIVFLVLLSTPSFAVMSSFVCIDSVTSREIKTMDVTTDAGTSPITIQEDVICAVGCDDQTGMCKAENKSEMMLVVLFFIVIIFSVLYVILEALGYMPT